MDKLFVFSGDGQIEIVHGSYSDYKDSLDESSGGKRPFYMANTDTSIASKTDKSNKSETSSGSDDSSLSTSVDGSDSNIATFGEDTFKETPKKGLNKAEEAEYANIPNRCAHRTVDGIRRTPIIPCIMRFFNICYAKELHVNLLIKITMYSIISSINDNNVT